MNERTQPDEQATMPPAQRPPEEATLPPALQDQTAPTLAPSGPAVAAADARAPAGYEIERELGRGGMGVVYKARSLALQRACALKVVLSGAHVGGEEARRFRTEAQAIARLQHPGIVQVFEVGEHDGRPFMALEFCSGGSLDAKLAKSPLKPKAAARLVEQLAEAVQAAHEAQVIHRDLKPANVLLTEKGEPKVTDFGLAKKLDEDGATRTGSVMGTPSYMPPEQAEGKKDVGPVADVYALGAILYECLTGRPPFRAATPLDTILQVVSEEPVPPRALNPSVPADLETICLKCLRKEPAKRYRSARALANDLGRFLDGEPIKARPVGALERGYRWVRRNPVVFALSAIAVLALLLGTGFSLYYALQARASENQARQAEQKARAEATRSAASLHAIQMGLALRAWEEGDIEHVEQVLKEVAPAFQESWETRFLTGLSRRTARPLPGHPGDVRSVCISRDGRTMVSGGIVHAGGARGALKLWDVRAGTEKAPVTGLTAFLNCVCLSPDGRTLAAGGHDGRILLWDAQTGGGPKRTIQAHIGGAVHCVCFSCDGELLASAGADRAVKVWGARDGQLKHRLVGHTSAARCVCFSPGGEALVSGGDDRSLRWWDTRSGKQTRLVWAHADRAYSVAFSPDGLALASGGGWPENAVKLWDATTGQQRLTMRGHTHSVLGVGFSPNGKAVVSSGYDHVVKVWDARTGQLKRTLAGHTQSALSGCSACFSPDGQMVLSGSGTDDVGTPNLLLWDLRATPERLTFRGHASDVKRARFSPDSSTVVSAGEDSVVWLWDARTGKPRLALRGHGKGANDACFSPDGKTVASGGNDGMLLLWDAASGKRLSEFTHGDEVTCVAFSPDGKLLLSGSRAHTPTGQSYRPGGCLKLWDVQAGKVLFALEAHSYGVKSAGFSPDGETIIANGETGIQLWGARTGKTTRSIPFPTAGGGVTSACFSPDGETILACAGFSVRLLDAQSGKQLFEVKERLPVNDVGFSPDGKTMIAVTGGFYTVPGELKLYDPGTGQSKLSLKRHASLVNSGRFSPDGKAIVTASHDRTVKVWAVD